MSDNTQNESTSNSIDVRKVQQAVSIGQFIWTTIIGAAVFLTTLWTTQSVSSTRISQLEKQVDELKIADDKINNSLAQAEGNTRALLLEISTRLREIELKMTELQTRLSFVMDQKNGNK